jgi:hypothetical protein
LDDPNGVRATLADSEGQPVARVVADEDGAFMLLEALQDLPEGRAYQLWSVGGPEPVSLGMLGREGTNTGRHRVPGQPQPVRPVRPPGRGGDNSGRSPAELVVPFVRATTCGASCGGSRRRTTRAAARTAARFGRVDPGGWSCWAASRLVAAGARARTFAAWHDGGR